jgi:Ca-activated chloride channel family protein
LEVLASSASTIASAAIPSVWANMKIADLNAESTYSDDPRLTGQMRQVALDHNLMSAFTAFVAVDASRRTEGTYGVTVPVAVPVPDGVRYDTTVNERPRQP